MDTQVDEEGGKQWDDCGGHRNGHSRGNQLVVLAAAVVEEGGPAPRRHRWSSDCLCIRRGRRDELEGAEQQSDEPDEEQDAGRIGLGEPVVFVVLLILTYHAESHVVLDCSCLQCTEVVERVSGTLGVQRSLNSLTERSDEVEDKRIGERFMQVGW